MNRVKQSMNNFYCKCTIDLIGAGSCPSTTNVDDTNGAALRVT